MNLFSRFTCVHKTSASYRLHNKKLHALKHLFQLISIDFPEEF